MCAVDNGKSCYYFCDGNGNVGQVVEGDGEIAARYEYDAFGKAVKAEGDYDEGNAFRFSTKYFDGESGFYYYGFRYYLPELGKWGSRDPMGEEGGINIIGFPKNNAVNLIDILGLFRHPRGGRSKPTITCQREFKNWSEKLESLSELIEIANKRYSRVQLTLAAVKIPEPDRWEGQLNAEKVHGMAFTKYLNSVLTVYHNMQDIAPYRDNLKTCMEKRYGDSGISDLAMHCCCPGGQWEVDHLYGTDMSIGLGLELTFGTVHCQKNTSLKVDFETFSFKAGFSLSVGVSYKGLKIGDIVGETVKAYSAIDLAGTTLGSEFGFPLKGIMGG